MNLKLDLSDIKKYLPILQKVEPYIFGAALIALFGYTAAVVNAALNVQPGAAPPTAGSQAKISFDKATIDAVKKLSTVNGDVPIGDLGKDDPFK